MEVLIIIFFFVLIIGGISAHCEEVSNDEEPEIFVIRENKAQVGSLDYLPYDTDGRLRIRLNTKPELDMRCTPLLNQGNGFVLHENLGETIETIVSENNHNEKTIKSVSE